MDKTKGVIVSDRYEMDAPLGSLTQTFMTVCRLDISQPGKIGFKLPNQHAVVLEYDPELWDVTKEKMQLIAPRTKA